MAEAESKWKVNSEASDQSSTAYPALVQVLKKAREDDKEELDKSAAAQERVIASPIGTPFLLR